MILKLCCLFFLSFSKLCADQNIDLTVSIIQTYLSKDLKDSINQWDELMAPAVWEVMQRLPQCGEGETFEKALFKALRGLTSASLTIKRRELNRENQPKELFFAFNKEKGMYALKIYEANSTLFLADFWGQYCSSLLKLNKIGIPAIQTACKIAVAGKEHLLLVEDYVEGQSFNELIKDPNANLIEVFTLLGKSLKAFYEGSSFHFGPLTEPFQKYLNKMIAKGIDRLTPQEKEWLSPMIAELSRKLEGKSFPACYVHGDPNFGNFMINNGQISLIDFEEAGKFINAKKIGLAPPIYDLILLLDYIGQLKLDQDKLQDLRKAFINGYGTLPFTQEEFLYFSIVDFLNTISWFKEAEPKLTEFRQHEVLKLIDQKKTKIKSFENL